MEKFRTRPITVLARQSEDDSWIVENKDGSEDLYSDAEFREMFEPDNYTEFEKFRFLEKVDRSNGDDGCWMWTSALDKDGYGKVTINYRDLRAHRVSYEMFVNKIPDGMVMCHRCDTPGCVNPSHLFVGTNADNSRDRDEKGRGIWRSDRNPKAKITAQQVIEIREKYLSGDHTYSTLSREYGVQPVQIKNIIKRKEWSWLLP